MTEDALELWKEKLAFLQAEEARTSDAEQKFSLKMKIAEAEAKIQQLSRPGGDRPPMEIADDEAPGASPAAVRRIQNFVEDAQVTPQVTLAKAERFGNRRWALRGKEPLGQGRFGVVWRAIDFELDTDVVIKFLRPKMAKDAKAKRRFFRGAQVLKSLEHPNIVRVLEAEGIEQGYGFFVMEYISGGDVGARLRNGKMDLSDVSRLVKDIGAALQHMHTHDRVHRDVKPSNILVNAQGQYVLSDFDLVHRGGPDESSLSSLGGQGTLRYAAPEVMLGDGPPTAQGDLFSLGMTVLEALHGKGLPKKAVLKPDRYVERLAVSEPVQRVLLKALEHEAEDRWASVEVFVHAWTEAAAKKEAPPSGRRTTRRVVRPAKVLETKDVLPAPSPWAAEQGKDTFGWWADVELSKNRRSPSAIRFRMRWIPPGTFLMGSPETEAGRDDDEGPQHSVTLTEGFWLAETPCTQAVWQAVMGDNPSQFVDPARPMEQVRWNDVQSFMTRLNQRVSGLSANLPTEAQWEYACRAGTTTSTYAGELVILGQHNGPILDSIAWYGGNSGVDFNLDKGEDSSGWLQKQHAHTKAGTHPVKGKAPNRWGLYDMLGNVWEWCRDPLRPYGTKLVTDPIGQGEGAPRVVRGGSWYDVARYVRAAYRSVADPSGSDGFLGFRVSRGQALR